MHFGIASAQFRRCIDSRGYLTSRVIVAVQLGEIIAASKGAPLGCLRRCDRREFRKCARPPEEIPARGVEACSHARDKNSPVRVSTFTVSPWPMYSGT